MEDFLRFADKMGVHFKNIDLLRQAFTHRSYLNEHKKLGWEHNERLEFLGDAVLELAVSNFLYRKFPNEQEGILTLYRSALVNTNTISSAAKKLGMEDFLLLSKGESKDTGRARSFILANTFEAVIGAIYFDQGYEKAENFISQNIFPLVDEVIKKRSWQDSKSRFQELAQEKVSITPIYQTIREVGPDHDKHFVVGAFIGDELVAEGDGKSKQEAAQVAAENALKAKGWE